MIGRWVRSFLLLSVTFAVLEVYLDFSEVHGEVTLSCLNLTSIAAKTKASGCNLLDTVLGIPIPNYAMTMFTNGVLQIVDKKTLKALIDQSAQFRAIFEPILKSEFVLRINDTPLEWFQRADFPDGIEFTKTFEVLVDDKIAVLPWNKKNNEIYTSYIIGMIARMPILHTFKYVPLYTFVARP